MSFKSHKKELNDSLKKVPRKYRATVTSMIKTKEIQEKFMIDKGLVGQSGTIDKVVKEVANIEEHALEKIHQTRINLAK